MLVHSCVYRLKRNKRTKNVPINLSTLQLRTFYGSKLYVILQTY